MTDRGDTMVRLCALAEIEDGKASEFYIELGDKKRLLVALRAGDEVRVYLNYCPHAGRPLNISPGRFMMENDELLCAFHYAAFRIDDGYCTIGPCQGYSLAHFETRVENGDVFVGQTFTWPEPRME